MLEILQKLIGFDTTSRNSNLALIGWVDDYLSSHGARTALVHSIDGNKASLYASFGPDAKGGVVLSGHSDVVPVDGQNWTGDPFLMDVRGSRVFGRGACDMKGFIACALACAPAFARADLARPIHFAFSYDEEIGCLGAPDLIAAIAKNLPEPAAVIVGEPSLMQVVSAHKGLRAYRVKIRGKEAHSSQPHKGASAIFAAARLMGELDKIAQGLRQNPMPGALFDPPYSTLTIGTIKGGTAGNIIAGECIFSWDLRLTPQDDGDAIEARFTRAVKTEDAKLRNVTDEAGIVFKRLAAVPPLKAEPQSAAEQIARLLTGDNARRAVAYTTEAGQFQEAGFPAIICGPGSIDQAHKADEYVELAQLEQCMDVLQKLPNILAR